MDRKREMVVGVFRDRATAQSCHHVLLSRGYFDADINLLMSEETRDLYALPPTTAADPVRHEMATTTRAGTKAAEGMGVGGAVGTALGGSIAAIAAMGTSLLIPGLNLVVAGPLAAALAGGGAGAITGGILGGLVGLGIRVEGVEAYHKALREGSTILGVRLHDHDDLANVRQLLKDCGAEHIETVI